MSGLQIHEEGDAGKEVTEKTQDYNVKGVVLTPCLPRCVIHGNALRQHRATAAASDTPGDSGRSSHDGTRGPCALTPI
jgi:hypothetical protein